jgi:hypothetical protein
METNISIASAVIGLGLLSTTGCRQTLEAFHDDNVVHVASELCHLGDVILAEKDSGKVRSCQPYQPALNHGDACKGWSRPDHTAVINALAATAGPIPGRISQLPATIVNPPSVMHQGDVQLMRGSLDVGVVVPSYVQAGAHSEAIDLIVRLQAARIELDPAKQLPCMKAQTAEDLRSIGVPSTQKVLGFVSTASLGFAHRLRLVDVNVQATAANVVKLDAGAFSLATTVQGGIDPSYLPKLEQLLKKLDGSTAAVSASALGMGVDSVTTPVTISVTYTPFSTSN